jgi:muramoyltetrapeptide carboxypeptidase
VKILKPSKLKKGDLIGIVSPASPIADLSKIDRGIRYLESLGYRALVGEHVSKTAGYLAGTDDQRVADLHAMFANRRVKAILSVRGGYGTPRLLPLLDYKLVARNPKILVGFSDLTALQLALWKRCSLVTFHGPMLGVDMVDGMESFSEEMFWRMVTSAHKPVAMQFGGEEGITLCMGRSSGRLFGGNLSLLVNMIGTRYLPDFRNAILFLEEINEEPYKVDRMLMQMRNAGILKGVKAVLGGQFTDCVPKDPKAPSRQTAELLKEMADLLRVPFLAGLPFSHLPRKMTLPIGLRVNVDADKRMLEFLEAAVE